ncbi:MAG: hypothetical protein ACYCW6_04150 [Candidatus Xenobia bacterium]
MQKLRRAYATDEVRELVQARLKAKRDEASRLEHALETGREEGRQEERQGVVARLMAAGMEREAIRQALGLTADEIPQAPRGE